MYARDGTALRKGVTVVKEEDDWPMVRHQLQDEFKQSGINLEFDGVRFYGKSGAVYLSPKVMFMGGEETEAVDLYTSEEDAKKGRPTILPFSYQYCVLHGHALNRYCEDRCWSLHVEHTCATI